MTKTLRFLIAALAFLALVCGCGAKPKDDASQNGGKMAEAKANYEAMTVKVANMRAEATKLRMSGNADDAAKATQIEQEANRLEQDALKGLNPM